MDNSIDTAASVGLCAALAVVLAYFAVMSPRASSRLAREAPLPIVGKAPMEAVYAAITPMGRLLAALGVSANAVTVASVVFAALAAIAFATGHFGIGAAIACVAALCDAVDGLLARVTGTASRFGQVLDTMIDRYVDALFIGGIAIYVRHDAWLLGLSFAALVGSFMVSYASSVVRELNVPEGRVSMRRAERLTALIVGAALVPFVAKAYPPALDGLAPIVVALALIAVLANVNAVQRILRAGRAAPPMHIPPPDSDPVIAAAEHARERLSHH